MSKSTELLDKLRGYIDLPDGNNWKRYMLMGWFSPGKVSNYHFTYEHRGGGFGLERLGMEKGIPDYKCVVSGESLEDTLLQLEAYLKENGYYDLLVDDAHTHFEEVRL